MLRQLKEWSGLTLRTIESRTRGLDRPLSRSTIAATLARDKIPRHHFLAAYVQACGADPSPWQHARARLAVAAAGDGRAHGVVPVQRLPAHRPHLVGRQTEADELRQAILDPGAGTPITVLSGGPGVGKSALALHVAHAVAPHFPDGQLYLNLHGASPGRAPLTTAQAAAALLDALGVVPDREIREADVLHAQLRTRLRGLRMLIVLDNAASVAQVLPLLWTPESGRVVVTSRSSLTTVDGACHRSLGPLSARHAVAMLEGLLGPSRTAVTRSVHDLAELCDRLPLALRIAAARLMCRPAWPVTALTERLANEDRRLDQLSTAGLCLRASLACSTDLLSASGASEDRLALRTFDGLGALRTGPFDVVAAARAVGLPADLTERAMERLVEVNLVDGSLPGHYVLPELIRLFAAERAAVPRRAIVAVEREEPVTA
ncbi:AAA family ATPase [Actinoplanes solisilvae]|uniref:AAA family ATPase n=1 Tax=Actinoplanes solisilvae TaxID=2486853 RepID=UPI000FD8B588|nr:AAA family ATPase [Actinoplanes solisilvae]